MTNVWLLRHAETASPTVFHGAESDEVLSSHGESQAIAAAAWFHELKPDVVISTKMRRAIATAAPIARLCKIPHRIEESLHERRIGQLCGTSFSLTDGPWVETLTHWTAGDTAYTTPGAESYDDLVQRLVPAWNRVIDANTDKRIVLVTHGIVCKVLLLTLLKDWGPRRWHELGKVHNLSTSHLSQIDGEWTASSLLVVPPPVLALRAVPPVHASQA